MAEQDAGVRQESDGYYEAYWPRAPRKGRPRAPAKRLGTLKGKTIAQLWTLGFRGDQLFTALEEGLSRRYPGIRFISWKEFGNIHGPDEREIVAGLPEKLRAMGVDGVISGMAC